MNIEDIRKMYDLVDIVERAGVLLKGGATKKWGLCPFPDHVHKSFTPSFSIYWTGDRQRFKCHGSCGRSGDVIDFAGYMNDASYNSDDNTKYVKAANLLSGGRYEISIPTRPPPTPSLPQWLADDCIPANSTTLRYAFGRGIGIDQIKKFSIGQPTPRMEKEPYNLWDPQKWITIPTFHGDELMGIKLRNNAGGRIRYMNVSGSRKGLFNYNGVAMSTEAVLVVKGEITAMVADGFGFLACAPTGGEGSYMDGVIHALAFAKVLVIGDNDNRDLAERRATQLNAKVAFPPKDYNGWDDWVLSDLSAIERTKQWMQK